MKHLNLARRICVILVSAAAMLVGSWDGGSAHAALTAAGGSSAPAGSGSPAQMAAEDADWILTAQLPDGALCWYPDKKRISPYLAGFAAWGLVRAYEVTGHVQYRDAAYQFLQWYQAHEDANGFVTDYDVRDGKEISTGDEDSTDAYAGLFLLAAYEWRHVDRDPRHLRSLVPGIRGAVMAIRKTQEPDGLTWAKPSYKVKYLMDQSESYTGLLAGARLLQELHDSAGARQAEEAATAMRRGVATLWSGDTYDWARTERDQEHCNWDRLYPDATSEVWPAALGNVLSPELDTRHSAELVSQFLAHWPHWDDPASPARFEKNEQPAGYWPAICLALNDVGRRREAIAAAQRIRAAALAGNRAWPYTVGIAGELIVAETLGAP